MYILEEFGHQPGDLSDFRFEVGSHFEDLVELLNEKTLSLVSE